MEKKYYVHTKKDANGDYEVHKEGCHKMPKEENRKFLGEFSNCEDAVKEAEKEYDPVNGCIHCSKDCHTQ